MLNAVMTRTVAFCTRHAWGVILFTVILAAFSGTYSVRQFSIDTNVNNLISRDLPWRKRELEYQAAFPQSQQLILVVVEAPLLRSKPARQPGRLQRVCRKRLSFSTRSKKKEVGRSFSRTVSYSSLRIRSQKPQANLRTPKGRSVPWRGIRACVGLLRRFCLVSEDCNRAYIL